ncbi:MAG: PEP-CTERM sorting domain-containing protein [Burkholderiaceae bacterium]|nr:PEP-CTERM sorting domain-containing protein [Burkholderiaceae bacterium]
MKLRSAILAAALVAALPSAFAEDIASNVPLVAGSSPGWYSAGFSVTHLVDGLFTDTFTFSPPIDPSNVDASLVTIGFDQPHNVDFTSATLNGTPMSLQPTGIFEAGFLTPTFMSGPLTLTVIGNAGDNASYAGTLNVTPVPEPEMYGMMLGGLALLGAMARRRKQDQG